jgi:hypothetical protein
MAVPSRITGPSIRGGGVYNDGAALAVESATIFTANTPDQCFSTSAVTNCNAT